MKAGAGRAYDAELPFYFQGQQINKRAMHLVDSSLFVPGVHSARRPTFKKKGHAAR